MKRACCNIIQHALKLCKYLHTMDAGAGNARPRATTDRPCRPERRMFLFWLVGSFDGTENDESAGCGAEAGHQSQSLDTQILAQESSGEQGQQGACGDGGTEKILGLEGFALCHKLLYIADSADGEQTVSDHLAGLGGVYAHRGRGEQNQQRLDQNTQGGQPNPGSAGYFPDEPGEAEHHRQFHKGADGSGDALLGGGAALGGDDLEHEIADEIVSQLQKHISQQERQEDGITAQQRGAFLLAAADIFHHRQRRYGAVMVPEGAEHQQQRGNTGYQENHGGAEGAHQKTGGVSVNAIAQRTHASGQTVVGGRAALDGVHADAVGQRRQQMHDGAYQTKGSNADFPGQHSVLNQNIAAQHQSAQQKQQCGSGDPGEFCGDFSQKQLNTEGNGCGDAQEKTDLTVGEIKYRQNISGKAQNHRIEAPVCNLQKDIRKGYGPCPGSGIVIF